MKGGKIIQQANSWGDVKLPGTDVIFVPIIE